MASHCHPQHGFGQDAVDALLNVGQLQLTRALSTAALARCCLLVVVNCPTIRHVLLSAETAAFVAGQNRTFAWLDTHVPQCRHALLWPTLA